MSPSRTFRLQRLEPDVQGGLQFAPLCGSAQSVTHFIRNPTCSPALSTFPHPKSGCRLSNYGLLYASPLRVPLVLWLFEFLFLISSPAPQELLALSGPSSLPGDAQSLSQVQLRPVTGHVLLPPAQLQEQLGVSALGPSMPSPCSDPVTGPSHPKSAHWLLATPTATSCAGDQATVWAWVPGNHSRGSLETAKEPETQGQSPPFTAAPAEAPA